MDLTVKDLGGYTLVDSGDGRKLERFGGVLVDRPAGQAIWPSDPKAPWGEARAAFQRGEAGTGDWQVTGKPLPGGWETRVGALSFEIRLTGFGNVGLFPEHAAHWKWMSELLRGRHSETEVLNLFAYTGGASMAAALAGARVVHVDSAKAVNTWAMENAERTRTPEDRIRFLSDDALKLCRREFRRSRRYQGIVLDPPTFGRGPKGEVWKIERDMAPLIEACRALLADDALFVLATAHSPGVTPAVLRGLLAPLGGRIEDGEMLLAGPPGRPALPAGAYARWTQGS
ncbi:MAG: class I SAM-dependent methyltransferase [Deltaproteobacteria bacterium]|nr:class I SAM-dependent methyltransferase [Deltaproteobacteria bacterium]